MLRLINECVSFATMKKISQMFYLTIVYLKNIIVQKFAVPGSPCGVADPAEIFLQDCLCLIVKLSNLINNNR
jgi:hypothetical protein